MKTEAIIKFLKPKEVKTVLDANHNKDLTPDQGSQFNGRKMREQYVSALGF